MGFRIEVGFRGKLKKSYKPNRTIVSYSGIPQGLYSDCGGPPYFSPKALVTCSPVDAKQTFSRIVHNLYTVVGTPEAQSILLNEGADDTS